ncbi:SusC/RagA family TonB-linked outer membrane protein [Aestuariivivens sediminis]|uniref:SusC/RagA family TonB-linked outer membrane protein n=1 Tax=Aestuariivivens sediminis TaxID=2913557 RepID=UPI001F594D86|nr:TonB-dependent receptor [Aestuariivivens sediminis]
MKKNKLLSILSPINYGIRLGFILFMCTAFLNVHAQQIALSGSVVDEMGVPLPGVNIIVDGTTRGTQTDFDGNYSINATPSEVITFSYVGMKSISVLVGNQTNIRVTMETDAQLDEVVVIGYGTKKIDDVVGSVAIVDPEEMTKVATADVGEMLRGQATGVRVTLGNTGVGQSSNIVVRGQASLTNNSPLIIVDGVPAGALNDINPNDIASLSVLKDAASLAIYGARAANGVILITTKRGKTGKATVTYNGSSGIQTFNKGFETYSPTEWADMVREGDRHANLGIINSDEVIFASLYNNIQNGITTDFEDLILRSGTIHNHNISLSAGTENTSVYASVNYLDQKGIVINTDYDRVTTRINATQKITDWLDMGANIMFQYSNASQPRNVNGAISLATAANPWGTPYNDDGSFKLFYLETYNSDITNPLVDLYETTSISESKNDMLNLYANFGLFKGFNYKLNLSRRTWNNKNRQYSSLNSESGLRSGFGSGFHRYRDVTEWQLENILTFSTDFDTDNLHQLDLTAVQSVFSTNYTDFQVNGTGFVTDALMGNNLDLASAVTIGRHDGSKRNLASFVARAEYNYDSRYYLSASIRADASSVFAQNEKWGYFPAVGVSWNAHNERFLQDVDAVNNLKLSLSYGQIGNQEAVSPYGTLILASIGRTDTNAGIFTENTSRFISPDLTWETTTNLNAKLDFGFFNRLRGTVEYYINETTDLIQTVNLSADSGFDAQVLNVGTVENRGIEVGLSGDLLKTDDLTVNLAVTYTNNTNEIIDLGGDQNGDGVININDAYQTTNGNWLIPGQPISVSYRNIDGGIWQEGEDIQGSTLLSGSNNTSLRNSSLPGWYKPFDGNGDGVYDPVSDRVIIPLVEDWFGSAVLNVNYKGFDLTANFLAVQGLSRQNNFLSGYAEGGDHRGIFNTVKQNYWTPENPGGTFARPITSGSGISNVWWGNMQDASYVRLQNVTIGYSLPADALSNIGLSKLRIYVTGSNLWTDTDFQSFSPEASLDRSPEPVTIVAGLQLGI